MCSGADPDLLEDSPKSERIKYAGIGGTVFFTALMATLASSYAFYIVFDQLYLAASFGLIWGLLIFNLDRYIVSTIIKQDQFRKELLQASPRIILAVIIALVISKPLELKIFEKEIDRVLLEQKENLTLQHQAQVAGQYQSEIDRLEGEILSRKSAIERKEKEVDALYHAYIHEAEGTQGTLKIGKGPVYTEKRSKHDTEAKALQQLRTDNRAPIARLEEELAILRQQQAARVAEGQPVIDGFDGLLARLSALNELPFLPGFFIFLLFLAIETAPIMAKLLAPIGFYDLRFNDAVADKLSWMKQKSMHREALRRTDQQLNETAFGELSKENELALFKKQKAREILAWQAEAFYKDQQKWV